MAKDIYTDATHVTHITPVGVKLREENYDEGEDDEVYYYSNLSVDSILSKFMEGSINNDCIPLILSYLGIDKNSIVPLVQVNEDKTGTGRYNRSCTYILDELKFRKNFEGQDRDIRIIDAYEIKDDEIWTYIYDEYKKTNEIIFTNITNGEKVTVKLDSGDKIVGCICLKILGPTVFLYNDETGYLTAKFRKVFGSIFVYRYSEPPVFHISPKDMKIYVHIPSFRDSIHIFTHEREFIDSLKKFQYMVINLTFASPPPLSPVTDLGPILIMEHNKRIETEETFLSMINSYEKFEWIATYQPDGKEVKCSDNLKRLNNYILMSDLSIISPFDNLLEFSLYDKRYPKYRYYVNISHSRDDIWVATGLSNIATVRTNDHAIISYMNIYNQIMPLVGIS